MLLPSIPPRKKRRLKTNSSRASSPRTCRPRALRVLKGMAALVGTVVLAAAADTVVRVVRVAMAGMVVRVATAVLAGTAGNRPRACHPTGSAASSLPRVSNRISLPRACHPRDSKTTDKMVNCPREPRKAPRRSRVPLRRNISPILSYSKHKRSVNAP